MNDPREWTARQRDAVLASLLWDFLAAVPTERTSWTAELDELRRRTEAAREYARQMDRVNRERGPENAENDRTPRGDRGGFGEAG